MQNAQGRGMEGSRFGRGYESRQMQQNPGAFASPPMGTSSMGGTGGGPGMSGAGGGPGMGGGSGGGGGGRGR